MSTKPTPEKIAAEIAALQELQPKVRPFSAFNDDNRAAIDAQVDVLTRRLSVSQVYDRWGEDTDAEELGEEEFDQNLLDCALQAAQWLIGELADGEESPAASWKGLCQ